MIFARSMATILITAVFALPGPGPALATPPVYTVLFTHIEDSTPAGALGTPQCRANYLLYRGRLISMADLARSHGIPWTLQPDWKILQAALLYEDASLTGTTNGKNVLRYLKEDLGVIIDAHSHEMGGYNYTDVAHLLDSLGVGATTVIGGHVWDPTLPEFAEWDRFRVPVAGERYPWALWRGDILMGSGTPNHVSDPVVSGVWRPRDRDHYFEDDPAGNIVAIGQFRGTLAGVPELLGLYQSGAVSNACMLTSSYHLKPSALIATGGIAAIEDTVINPLVALRDAGSALPTDFTSLVQTWRTTFAAHGCLYDAGAVSGVAAPDPTPSARLALAGCTPNPCATGTVISYTVPGATHVRLEIFDARGRLVRRLVDAPRSPGSHAVRWDATDVASGTYYCRLTATNQEASTAPATTRKITLVR